MVSVSSSNINDISYDKQSETLEVTFNSGARWEYHNVPEDVYEDFMSAGSHGRYFHYSIKNAYSGREI